MAKTAALIFQWDWEPFWMVASGGFCDAGINGATGSVDADLGTPSRSCSRVTLCMTITVTEFADHSQTG
ncbi:MAG: hypothetical protein ACLTNO_03665 [Blautia sp.]